MRVPVFCLSIIYFSFPRWAGRVRAESASVGRYEQLSEPETQAFYRLPGMPLSRDLLFFLSNAFDFVRYDFVRYGDIQRKKREN